MCKISKNLLILLFLLTTLLVNNAFSSNAVDLKETKCQIFKSGVSSTEVESILSNTNEKVSRKHTIRILENSVQYRAYVRKRINELALPPCLEYLPIIESDYKPTAKPPTGISMGIWQFMPNSVSPYMELSEYVDERRDPWISTEGALKKLNENYKTFGDWLLALAAYNCGSGAVSRALKTAKVKTFSGLCEEDLIPRHAQVYVQRFLVLCDLIMNAPFREDNEVITANSIDAIEDSPYFFYDDFEYVTVDKSISLSALALELKIDYQILHNLNLSLIKDVTPPNRKYKIRVPRGMKISCIYAINELIKKNEVAQNP